MNSTGDESQDRAQAPIFTPFQFRDQNTATNTQSNTTQVPTTSTAVGFHFGAVAQPSAENGSTLQPLRPTFGSNVAVGTTSNVHQRGEYENQPSLKKKRDATENISIVSPPPVAAAPATVVASHPFTFGSATTANNTNTEIALNTTTNGTFPSIGLPQSGPQPATAGGPFSFGSSVNAAPSAQPPTMDFPGQPNNGGLQSAAPFASQFANAPVPSVTPLFGSGSTTASPALFGSSTVQSAPTVPPTTTAFVFGGANPASVQPASTSSIPPPVSAFPPSNPLTSTAVSQFPTFNGPVGGGVSNTTATFGPTNAGFGASNGMNASSANNNTGGLPSQMPFGSQAATTGFPTNATSTFGNSVGLNTNQPGPTMNGGGFGVAQQPGLQNPSFGGFGTSNFNAAPPQAPPAFGANMGATIPPPTFPVPGVFGSVPAVTGNQNAFQMGAAPAPKSRRVVRARRP
jgi:hypothetical protein